ncbi:MAG: sigma-54-dependent Fis family transcriptional regulator, partial [Planctomycetales bacterium]|nr:sigma-54-dependent Fis family transcriptional regulator [Planctomycetales bacterium]
MPEIAYRVLMVDDEASQRALLESYVTSQGYVAETVGSAEAALERLAQQTYHMVLLDVRLPGIDGIEALRRIRADDEQLPVMLITAHADLRQAVIAMKGGADDYLTKPIDLDELGVAISDALGDRAEEGPAKLAAPPLPDGFICESAAMRRLVETLAIVAPSDAPVLLTGESGAGKELAAQLIHR